MEVLLVEDNPGDVRLTQEAFREADSSIHLHVAIDGFEAVSFLRREGTYTNAPRPDLILLDLNMRKMDGREVFANLEGDDSLKSIPMVVLTISDAEADVLASYRLQANCYLRKPFQLDALEKLLKRVCDFWLKTVRSSQQLKSA